MPPGALPKKLLLRRISDGTVLPEAPPSRSSLASIPALPSSPRVSPPRPSSSSLSDSSQVSGSWSAISGAWTAVGMTPVAPRVREASVRDFLPGAVDRAAGLTPPPGPLPKPDRASVPPIPRRSSPSIVPPAMKSAPALGAGPSLFTPPPAPYAPAITARPIIDVVPASPSRAPSNHSTDVVTRSIAPVATFHPADGLLRAEPADHA